MDEESWKKAKGLFATVSIPPALWLLLFFVAPLAIVWAYSFGHNVGLTDIAVTGTFENYARAFEPVYLKIFFKSAGIAAVVTAVCLVLSFPVALAMTFASPKARIWLLLAIMLPFWTNLLIRTYALISLMRDQGFINMGLEAVWGLTSHVVALFSGHGLPPFKPLELLYTNFAVIVGLVYVQLPFMVLPLYTALDRMDRSLMEASLDLGAGHLRTLFLIVVPIALPGIASGVVLTFIPTLGAYLTPDLLGGADSQMIANVIESQFKRANDWPFGAALSFLLMYLTFFAIAAQGVLSRKGKGAR